MVWISSIKLEKKDKLELKKLKKIKGIVVPGGFGPRGIEGKIFAAKYARENKIPFLGICYGMQMAIIEFASVFLLRKKLDILFLTQTLSNL